MVLHCGSHLVDPALSRLDYMLFVPHAAHTRVLNYVLCPLVKLRSGRFEVFEHACRYDAVLGKAINPQKPRSNQDLFTKVSLLEKDSYRHEEVTSASVSTLLPPKNGLASYRRGSTSLITASP
jgi:hypothetical protein